MLVLDTKLTARANPVAAVSEYINGAEAPLKFRALGEPAETWFRLDHWELAPGAHITGIAGTGIEVESRSGVSNSFPDRASLTFVRSGDQVRGLNDSWLNARPGSMYLVDQTRGWSSGWAVPAASHSLIIDYERLRLPVDVVRSAIPNLERSPVYPLVRTHLALVCDRLDEMKADATRAMLGTSMIDLVRVLIATAGADTKLMREILDDSLVLRIERYIAQHLTEADLSPASIANAHHISVRQLYKVWSGQNQSLATSILRARLEGARREMMYPQGSLPIAAVANKWGFTNAAHFSKQFKDQFGVSPRDVRQSGAFTVRGPVDL
jgi:AraC-like DNA-binding protein